jgi:hypothetical protein
MADQVYHIDKAGNLSQCEREVAVVETTSDAVEVEAEGTASTDKINVRQTKPARLDTLDVASRVTDRTVYRTYFGAIGLKNLSVFVLFGLAFAVCIKFPGEYHIRNKLADGQRTNCILDIWAQWWSEDSQSSQKVGYWLGMYAMLQTLPLIMLCIWLGLVNIYLN